MSPRLDLKIIHTSAIVGGCLALAAGTAFASQVQETRAVSVVFFGDGAMEEGVFYESLNIAKLWQLPLIFLDGKQLSARRPQRRRAIARRNYPTCPERSTLKPPSSTAATSVRCIKPRANSSSALRAGEGPFFVEAQTHPWPGNDTTHPKLVAGKTDIKWAWDPSPVPENVALPGTPKAILYSIYCPRAGEKRRRQPRRDRAHRCGSSQASGRGGAFRAGKPAAGAESRASTLLTPEEVIEPCHKK